MLDELLQRFENHDRHALARLLTLVARGESVEPIRSSVSKIARSAGKDENDPLLALRAIKPRIVAITGSGGVGKSSLIGKLIDHLRSKQLSVAVLACDPQSPLTGGALLGDRFRMPSQSDDDGVFIRSLAALSGHEAIADRLDVMVDLLKTFGFDVILLETVGSGQGDTAVREVADVVVLLLQPEAGDDLQWEKAGVLEVADVVVVHKSDLPGAEKVEAQVRNLLNLPGCREVPVLHASAAKGDGLEELWSIVAAIHARHPARNHSAESLLRLAQKHLAERFQEQVQLVQPVLERWGQGTLDDRQAASELLSALAQGTAADQRR